MILVTLFISFYFFDLIIIMTCVFFLLWLTSYYAILVYCVLCAIIWVGGVDVYNVSYMLDAGMTTDSHIYPRRDLSLCCLLMCICFDYVYFRIA